MANDSQLYFIGLPGSSAKVIDYFTATDAVLPRGSSAFTLGRNNHPLTAFPQAQLSYVDFHGVLPDSGIVEVALMWAATVALGSVLWQAAWERDNATVIFPQENLDVDSFAPDKGVTSLAPPAPGLLRKASLIFTPAEMGDILPGDAYRLRVTRNALLPADTLVGNAQLFRVILGAP